MDQYSLDKIFKEGLQNHKTSLDKDALWSAIKEDVPSKKGFVYLKLLAGMCLLTVIGASFFLFGLNKQQGTIISDVSSYASSIQTSDRNTNLSTTTEEQSLETEHIVTKTKVSNISSTMAAPLKRTGSDKINIKNKVSNSLSGAMITKTITSSDNRKTSSVDIAPNTSRAASTIFQQNLIEVKTKSTTIKSTAISASKSEHQTSSISHMEALSLVEIKATTGLDYSRELPTLELLRNNKKIDCYEHGKKRAKISGEIYSSVDFVANHFSAAPEQTAYMERRNQTQTQLEGYRSGLRLKYALPNGFYVKAGLEAGLIRERFNDEISETTIEVWPNQLLDVIMQGDSTIYIYGDEEVSVTRQQLWRVENTYKMLGIPVLLGYEKQIGKFKYGIDFGAIHNILYGFDGYLSNNSGAPTDDPDFFKPSINLSLTGGLTMSYGLGKRTNLFAQTTFKHNLEDINNDLNEIQQRNTRIGLGLGLEYILR